MLTGTHTESPTTPTTDADLQKQIEALHVKLDQAQRMATLGELLSTTTHEFNNVLMSIMNYTRMAMRQQDDEARQRSLQKVMDATERAAKITNGILGAARNRGSQFESVDLKPLIDDTLVLIERELRKYRIELTQEIESVPAVLARGNEIQQVLLNLLINARQALPDGGEVLIRLSHDAENNVNELMIRDNGRGIPADKLPKIFEPFFTTKSGPDESGKGGTGLGLAACRDIIEAHNGRIRVASTEGKGTAFTLKLPAVSE
jgi:signal transduction histidine kinase